MFCKSNLSRWSLVTSGNKPEDPFPVNSHWSTLETAPKRVVVCIQEDFKYHFLPNSSSCGLECRPCSADHNGMCRVIHNVLFTGPVHKLTLRLFNVLQVDSKACAGDLSPDRECCVLDSKLPTDTAYDFGTTDCIIPVFVLQFYLYTDRAVSIKISRVPTSAGSKSIANIAVGMENIISVVGPVNSTVKIADNSPLQGPIPLSLGQGAYFTGSPVPKPSFLTILLTAVRVNPLLEVSSLLMFRSAALLTGWISRNFSLWIWGQWQLHQGKRTIFLSDIQCMNLQTLKRPKCNCTPWNVSLSYCPTNCSGRLPAAAKWTVA